MPEKRKQRRREAPVQRRSMKSDEATTSVPRGRIGRFLMSLRIRSTRV